MQYKDRTDAGRQLAAEMKSLRGRDGTIVVGLARGGVPVAYELAQDLHLPLDVLLARRLGVPGREELTMGLIASGGIRVLDENVIQRLGLAEEDVERAAQDEVDDLERRERTYRCGAPADLGGQVVILVADGLDSGETMRMAVQAVRAREAASVIVATPVAPAEVVEELRDVADEVVCLDTPEPFLGIGQWYAAFHHTTDEEVHALLERARARQAMAEERRTG